MSARKVMKVCPGCGKKKSIRTDRTYCSVGCARRHRASSGERKLVVAGDVHFPNHDPRAVNLFLRWVQQHKPTEIILNGDILDCYKISRWAQPGSPGPGMRAEVEFGCTFLGDLRSVAPRARIQYIEGNHEFRLRGFLNNQAAEVADLDHHLTIPLQLKFAEHKIKYVLCHGAKWFSTYIQPFDDLLVGHFAKTSCQSAYAAKALVDRYGESLVTGHGHTMGLHTRTMNGREVTGVEGGCLCDLHPPYCEPHHWRQGFVVAHNRPGERTHLERIEIINHAFYYGGLRYST